MKLARPISRLFTTHIAPAESERVYHFSRAVVYIKELHGHLLRTEQHTDSYAVSDVIRAYALSPHSLHKARFAFDQIKCPTLPVWNHMIQGLSQSDRPIDALHMFEKMRKQGLHGNNLTFIFILKTCGRISDFFNGKVVHGCTIKLGYESYLYVSNALISMHASCGELDEAEKLFDEMSNRDLVSWNSLICGYSQCNRYDDVLRLFDAMRAANVEADRVTMVKVVLACSYVGGSETIESVVKYIEANGVEIDVYLGNTLIDMYGKRGLVGLARKTFDNMVERNVVSWNTMIMGYAKAGDLSAARELFDAMPKRDVISWTSMITGYSQANRFCDAIKLFQEMMASGIKPDKITVATVLSAAAHIGTLDVGEAVHNYIHEHGVEMDIYVGNALIDMYCKCGSVEKASRVFDGMQEKDSVSWTSIVAGLAVNGFCFRALQLFSEMVRESVKPTHGAFVAVLLACTHAGLVDEGVEYFESMEKEYGLVPETKHYGCVVDLLSRSGNVERAYEFMKRMPMAPDVVMWRMLLGACKLHKNVSLAEIAARKVIELDPANSGNYVLSSSTYASAERWEDAMKMRKLIDEGDIQRPLGWSSIETRNASNKEIVLEDYTPHCARKSV
nr:pentatricopeptide repeat-containing protein At2g22410, mitochondrial-like [Ipomoea batatas]